MSLPLFSRNLYHTATYWSPGGNDGFGTISFNAPVAIKCRWQDTETLSRTPDGREIISSTVVYSDRELEKGGFLVEGSFSAASPVEGAREIRDNSRHRHLLNTKILYKNIL